MPGPKPRLINLNGVERQGLELLVRRRSTGQQKAIRARIVLQAADGKNNHEIVHWSSVKVFLTLPVMLNALGRCWFISSR